MKICEICLREFDEVENSDYNTAVAMEDIFVESTAVSNDMDLCPECREALGMLNLTGYGV